ncbi:hypothetical protein, partial [Parvimonas sp. D9]
MQVTIQLPILFGVKDKKFQLAYRQQNTPSDGGFIQSIDRISPTWWAQYQTVPLFGERYIAAQSFLDSLNGSLNPFLAYDPGRIVPYAYRNQPGVTLPWGFPSLLVSNYQDATITIGDGTPGGIISPTDYISYQDGE